MSIKVYGNGKKYLGLSTDEKPSLADVGSEFLETDSGEKFIFDGTQWLGVSSKSINYKDVLISEGSFFTKNIKASSYDLLTAFASSTGNISLSFRVANPDGDDYSWDPLGSMNSPSMRTSAQAKVSGIKTVKVVLENKSEEDVTTSLYLYLGKQGGGLV